MADPRTGKKYIVLETSTLKHDVNQETCVKKGGHLPEPRDEQENLFLDSLGADMFVLGINDKTVEAEWVFDSDGSPLTSLSWVNWRDFPDPPRGGSDANCAFMLRHHNHDLAGHRSQDWTDFPCTSGSYWEIRSKSLVCQKGQSFLFNTLIFIVILIFPVNFYLCPVNFFTKS